VLTTDQRGAIAETAIALQALKLGIDVYRPIGEGGRYDLIFDLGGRLIRVQCKTAVRAGDVVIIRCYSCRRSRDGQIKRGYTRTEVDAIAAYCAELERFYFLPLDCFPGQLYVQLRLAPTRNNQRVGVNWADQFEFAARLGATTRSGAIAQLGERLAGSQKGTGSSPVGSMLDSPRAVPSS
jgi:hypothetical protein